VNREYFTLVTIMLRIDLFSFGGGLAAMPIMYHELIDLFGWFDKKTFMDGVILGQVYSWFYNHSSYIFRVHALWHTRQPVSNCLRVYTIFSYFDGYIPFFDKLRSYPQFNKILNGILCSFVGLLASDNISFLPSIYIGMLLIF